MEITILESHEDLSQRAAAIILRQLEAKKDMLLCAATGDTPARTYELMAQEYRHRPDRFSDLRVLKLDEWGGLPMTDPGSCENYLRTRFLSQLNINDSRFLSFRSDPADPQEECRRIQGQLSQAGPIDCCLLGLGLNGHIGFNEPAPFLQPGCHIARLSTTTLRHTMVAGAERQPTYGLTLGMADILQAGMILILISGSIKKDIARKFLSKQVTPELPASFLWLHANVICLLDKEAAEACDIQGNK
ncbi:MAG TPA: galactosamine-6-phosphate isomerase [Puia sp.]|nr:galactosamine-6-phosphate isomerase [Puia sp.]